MRRPWALPLVPLYWLDLGAKNALWGRRRLKQLAWPVVSVGSLSAGGAGKTPVVMALAELVARHGVGVDVLSRGYGRGSGVAERVDPVGLATRFGDEPLEMARAGWRVFVGAERFEAGLVAEAAVEPRSQKRGLEHPELWRGERVHLLDDGFQHRRLGRAVDVVLLTLADAQDWLLPAGNLREPLSALRRANVVVVREEEASRLADLIARHSAAEIWIVRRELRMPADGPKKPIAFCGIARPDGFFAMLEGVGCQALGTVAFADHHAYRREDFDRLVAAGVDTGADGFVTTAKDAVKISATGREMLGRVGPVAVAGLRVSLVDEEDAWKSLRRHLGGSRGANPRSPRLRLGDPGPPARGREKIGG